jgi:hypothetical protein
MGVHRAFVQATPALVATNQYPNNSTITDAPLTTTSTVIITARSGNRRGMIIENDGTVPMIFACGSTVSVAARTALLFPNDIYEDLSGWQGPIAAASVGSNGAANFTEMVFI